ncbi:MAG: two-component system response regulator [Myxococcaceae bacterium]
MTSSNPTILIADDEPLVVSALARQARRMGMHFISDSTSEHVVEMAEQHKPDVIILDVRQKVDGRDLLAKLKANPQTSRCKVIMLSGVDDQFTRHTCFELGADDYEVKPFDICFMNKVARMAGVHS